MRLSNKQIWSILRSTARINIWHGSVRASKTYATLIKFIKLASLASKDGEIFLIGKTLDALKRNIITPLESMLGSDFVHKSGKRECHIWGRTIHTIGANDERSEGKIRGATVSLAYGDEITLWPENFFKMLDTRLSLIDSIFIGSTNPDNPNHYLKRDYLDRKGEIDLIDFHFVLDDNIFIPESVRENLKKNFTGLWYKRFILGMWCVAEGAIYDFFTEEECTLIRPPKADYYDIGIDYGTGNPTAFILTGNSFKRIKPFIWAEKEYYYDSKKQQRQKTDSEYSRDLINFVSSVSSTFDSIIESKYGMNKLLTIRSNRKKDVPLHDIFIDPSAASFKIQLKRDGISNIKDADNSVIDGIRTKSTMLKNGDYAICKCCKNYINEMYGYTWDSKAQDRGEDKPKKENDHCQDGGRYIIQTKFGKNQINYKNFSKW